MQRVEVLTNGTCNASPTILASFYRYQPGQEEHPEDRDTTERLPSESHGMPTPSTPPPPRQTFLVLLLLAADFELLVHTHYSVTFPLCIPWEAPRELAYSRS